MKRNKKPMPAILGVGTASIVFIFLVLALTIFALLTYGSASSDYRLSRRAANRMSAYYDASNRAQEHIGEVDLLLNEIYGQCKDADSYADEAEQALGRMQWADETQFGVTRYRNEIALYWREPMNDAQDLVVSLRVTPPETGDAFYEIDQYRVESAVDWNGDTPDSDKNQ